jgi:hypothetical protein
MTSFPLGVLIVVAATQAPISRPAVPDSAGAAAVTLETEGLPETSVGTHCFNQVFTNSVEKIQKAQLHTFQIKRIPPPACTD